LAPLVFCFFFIIVCSTAAAADATAFIIITPFHATFNTFSIVFVVVVEKVDDAQAIVS
jgi:hypothetical protein